MKTHSMLMVILIVTETILTTGCTAAPTGAGQTQAGGSNIGKNTVSNPANFGSYDQGTYHLDSGLTNSWLKTDRKRNSVTIQLTSPVNNLSLNGYSHGFAAIVVPPNWHVTVTFKNANQVISEGIAIVKNADIAKGTKAPLAFKGAATADYRQGTPPNGTGTFTFTPSKTGEFVVESVQTGQSGTWLWFTVSHSVSQPQVQTK